MNLNDTIIGIWKYMYRRKPKIYTFITGAYVVIINYFVLRCFSHFIYQKASFMIYTNTSNQKITTHRICSSAFWFYISKNI